MWTSRRSHRTRYVTRTLIYQTVGSLTSAIKYKHTLVTDCRFIDLCLPCFGYKRLSDIDETYLRRTFVCNKWTEKIPYSSHHKRINNSSTVEFIFSSCVHYVRHLCTTYLPNLLLICYFRTYMPLRENDTPTRTIGKTLK
jgi:hypothetical protein